MPSGAPGPAVLGFYLEIKEVRALTRLSNASTSSGAGGAKYIFLMLFCWVKTEMCIASNE